MSNIIGKSLHITWDDLACKDGTPYPVEFIRDGRLIELVVLFERIRAMYGLPIEINSAYRTIKYNKQVKGSSNSQHLYGKALDLQPPKAISLEKFYADIRVNVAKLGIRGLGKYSTFVHVDIRDSKELVTWEG